MQCLKRLSYSLKNTISDSVISANYKRNQLGICNAINRKNHNSNGSVGVEDEAETDAYKQLATEYLGIVPGGHKCFVLQPYIKWGKDKRRNTTPELQLAEAVALVNTLSNWVVIDEMCVPLLTLQRKKLLGSGGLENLKQKVRSNPNISAIFISTNTLKHVQMYELQKILGVPVYDRYSIVVQIFREHAKTPEAKLQVALAEIPYVWLKMSEKMEGGHRQIASFETRKLILQTREKRLKQKLEKLKEHRKIVRKQRRLHGFPSVAVVGYTNAGKTSLIKALTDDKSLQPENKLFATLDTTAHAGVLPCNLKVLYMDTIGFIQDIPETLIEPFIVTLEDAMIADIIVHVFDLSHPDVQAQIQHVHETIKPMTDADKPIIEVANKCDLLNDVSVPNNALAVSSVKLTGIDRLRLQIEKELLKVTGRRIIRVRVKSGSVAASWLYKETTVTDAVPDEKDSQFLILDVIATEDNIRDFKKFLKQ